MDFWCLYRLYKGKASMHAAYLVGMHVAKLPVTIEVVYPR